MSGRAHLIVKLGAIGDVIMALPAVKAFKAKTGGDIHWMSGQLVAPLLRHFPFVDQIIEVSDHALFSARKTERLREVARVWMVLAARRYETCAVLQYDWRYRLLALPVWARRTITLSRSDRSRRLLEGRYHGDEYARILLGEDGLRLERLAPLQLTETLPPAPLPRGSRKRVAVAPGGCRNLLRDDPLRRWPLSHYLELTGALLSRGYEVVLVGGPEDRWASPAFSDLPVSDFIGRLTVVESISLFNTCDLVVSHDTGPFHMATLSSAGVLALFGPTNPFERMPSCSRLRVIWGGGHLACRPCYDGREFAPCTDNRCMKDVSPDAVLEAAEQMLAGLSNQPQPVGAAELGPGC